MSFTSICILEIVIGVYSQAPARGSGRCYMWRSHRRKSPRALNVRLLFSSLCRGSAASGVYACHPPASLLVSRPPPPAWCKFPPLQIPLTAIKPEARGQGIIPPVRGLRSQRARV